MSEMKKQLRQELRRFGEMTSIKGIGRVIKAKSLVIKIFWILAMIICLSALLLQIVPLIVNYYKYDVINTSKTVTSATSFPTVTICNLLRVSEIEEFSEEYDKFVERIQFIKNQAPKHIKEHRDLWRFLQLPQTFFANRPFEQSLKNVKTVENDFVVECFSYGWDLFEYKNCTPSLAYTLPLQLCSTIGGQSGVSAITVIVYLNDFLSKPINSYFNWIRAAQATGVRVMIHPSDAQPDQKYSVVVSPGTDFTIAVKQLNVTRLPYPYGDCTDRLKLFPDDNVSPPYNQMMCISLCRQRQFINTCGCLDNYEYFTEVEMAASNQTFCLNMTQFLNDSPTYIDNDKLTDKFWSMLNCTMHLNPNESECDCPVQCQDVQYETSGSGARWPNVYQHLEFYKQYIRDDARYEQRFTVYEEILNASTNQSGTETIAQLERVNLIEQNFVKLTVKMQYNHVTLIREIAAVSWQTLTANLGGSFNLWLGISILTFVEIIEFLYSISCVILGKCRKAKEIPDQQNRIGEITG